MNINSIPVTGRRPYILGRLSVYRLLFLFTLFVGLNMSVFGQTLDLSTFKISKEDTAGLSEQSTGGSDCIIRIRTIDKVLKTKKDGKFNLSTDYWTIIRLQNMTNTTAYVNAPCAHKKANDLCMGIKTDIDTVIEQLNETGLKNFYLERFGTLKRSLDINNDWGGTEAAEKKFNTLRPPTSDTDSEKKAGKLAAAEAKRIAEEKEAAKKLADEQREIALTTISTVSVSNIRSVSTSGEKDTIELNITTDEWRKWGFGRDSVLKDRIILTDTYKILKDTISTTEKKDSVFRLAFIPVLSQVLVNSYIKWEDIGSDSSGDLVVTADGQIKWVNPSSSPPPEGNTKWMIGSAAFLLFSLALLVLLVFRQLKVNRLKKELNNQSWRSKEYGQALNKEIHELKKEQERLTERIRLQSQSGPIIPASPLARPVQDHESEQPVSQPDLPPQTPSFRSLYAPYPAVADRLNANEEKDPYDFFLLKVSDANATTGTVSIIPGLSGDTIMAAMRNRYKYLEHTCEFLNEYDENVHRSIHVEAEGKIKKEGPYWIIDSGQKMKIRFS